MSLGIPGLASTPSNDEFRYKVGEHYPAIITDIVYKTKAESFASTNYWTGKVRVRVLGESDGSSLLVSAPNQNYTQGSTNPPLKGTFCLVTFVVDDGYKGFITNYHQPQANREETLLEPLLLKKENIILMLFQI